MNLDIKIRNIINRDNISYWSSDSSNNIRIHKNKDNDYYISIKYTNKYRTAIEFSTINDRINYNYCYLFEKQNYRIEFTNNGSNKISKSIVINDSYYNYIYSITNELSHNTFNIYLLYKYLLSLKYLKKNNNMHKNILNIKKFTCMKNYKIIIYIAAI